MDPNNFNSSQPIERPIILSPPLLKSHGGSAPQHLPINSGRKQSEHFDLQEEFEALTADLDLDLKNKESDAASASAPASIPNGNISNFTPMSASGLAAPTASNYSLLRDMTGGKGTPKSFRLADDDSSATNNSSVTGSNMGLLGVNPSSSFLPPLASLPNRPQSVNDFSPFSGQQTPTSLPPSLEPTSFSQQSAFYENLSFFTNWIESLSTQDSVKMVEYLCSSLPFDILLMFKSKLDNQLASYNSQSKPFGSPYSQQAFGDLSGDIDSLHLNDNLRQQMAHSQQAKNSQSVSQHSNPSQGAHQTNFSSQLHQPKPKPNTFKSNSHLFVDPKNPRPKSAEPSLNGNPRYGNNNLERSKSPTSHLFEKTNFLQLAANANSPSFQPSHSGGPDDNLDLSAHAVVKLGALATINSRVALDSNRKPNHYNEFYAQQQAQQQAFQAQQHNPHLHIAETLHRMGNSPSASTYKNSNINPMSNKSSPSSGKNNRRNDIVGQHDGVLNSPSPSNNRNGNHAHHSNGNNNHSNSHVKTSNSAAGTPSTTSSVPSEVSSIELLNNIPAWLKLLRLHKYTECLKDIPWQRLIEMTDSELEERGVKALGARRKLLKAFDAVKGNIAA